MIHPNNIQNPKIFCILINLKKKYFNALKDNHRKI